MGKDLWMTIDHYCNSYQYPSSGKKMRALTLSLRSCGGCTPEICGNLASNGAQETAIYRPFGAAMMHLVLGGEKKVVFLKWYPDAGKSIARFVWGEPTWCKTHTKLSELKNFPSP
jgi:hypothetical protein